MILSSKRSALWYLTLIGVLLAGLGWMTFSSGQGQSPGIFYRHGEAFGEIRVLKDGPQPSRDLALGTHAAWAPDHKSLVFASNGKSKKLVLRSWHDGEEQDKVFPVPVVKTDWELEWQWSFSPDGRWLAVRRQVNWRQFGPRGELPEGVVDTWWNTRWEEGKKLDWLGVIDLKTWRAQQWKQWGAIIGWRNGACLLGEGQDYTPIFAVDPARPDKAERLVEDCGSVGGLSPDGRWAVIWDGQNGNIRVILQELGGKPLRILLAHPLHRAGQLVRIESAYGVFSPDSKWVAASTLLREDKGRTTSVSLESLDGKVQLYEDRFAIDDDDDMAVPTWAPGGASRFAYFRFRRGQEKGELVFVELMAGKAVATNIPQHVRQDRKLWYWYPPIWSPLGDRLAWLVKDRTILVCDVTTKETWVAGELPSDFSSWWGSPGGWSWASPRVGGEQ